jgi:hypothetical protein
LKFIDFPFFPYSRAFGARNFPKIRIKEQHSATASEEACLSAGLACLVAVSLAPAPCYSAPSQDSSATRGSVWESRLPSESVNGRYASLPGHNLTASDIYPRSFDSDCRVLHSPPAKLVQRSDFRFYDQKLHPPALGAQDERVLPPLPTTFPALRDLQAPFVQQVRIHEYGLISASLCLSDACSDISSALRLSNDNGSVTETQLKRPTFELCYTNS